MASKSEEPGNSVPISPSEYDEMKKKLENYNEMEQELSVAKKHLAKVKNAYLANSFVLKHAILSSRRHLGPFTVLADYNRSDYFS